MYILDTNVISALRKRRLENASVWTWAESHSVHSQYLSVITIFELERGTLRLERKDVEQGKQLRAWLNQQILPQFAGRFLPISADVARLSALFHVPDPKPERDAFIAATAADRGFALVTRNVRDFAGLGIELIDPWGLR